MALSTVRPGKVTTIYPRLIKVGERQRQLDPERVQELAMSILQNGQLQPIGVREEKDSKYTLIFGAHRVAAMLWLEEKGLDKDAVVWATVYPPEYPDGWVKMNELVENLHRLELTPAERAAHTTAYAGWCKKLGLVQAADAKRSVKQAEIEAQKANGTGDSDGRSHRSEPEKPTVTEKLIRDLGVTESTVHARQAKSVQLAKQGGLEIKGAKGIESMDADKLIETGEVAMAEAKRCPRPQNRRSQRRSQCRSKRSSLKSQSSTCTASV